MVDYEINSSTIMLEYCNENETKVYEFDKDFIVNDNLYNIVSNSCEFYGSTFKGRNEASKKILGTNIKVPIVIEDLKKIIYFPIRATYTTGNRWISFNNLDRIEKVSKNSSFTRLYFCNGSTYDVEISYEIIQRQLFNCLKLEKILLLRQERA